MREFSSDPGIPAATVVVKRAHDLMLDYIKEATQGLSKMSMNRIRRVSMEKDEWDALQAFEDIASEQQKGYARAYCKPALKSYHKKKKNFDLVAAHISHDVIPKILPQYDFDLPVDDTSLSSEQAQENRESMHKLSRDFRLEATELYLKIAKEEFEFQEEKLRRLLDDFPQDRYKVPSASTVTDEENGVEPIDDHEQGEGVLTQRPLPQRRIRRFISHKGSELYTKYMEIALKRALLETEREILFLAERGVNETPFVLQEARDLNPILRKDFVLQA
jgi:hypothetical protein